MVILWVTNPKTREDIPIEILSNAQRALDRKDELKSQYPDIIFFYSVNGLEIDQSEIRALPVLIEEIRADV